MSVIVLHVGPHKTGSSSIQATLSSSREQLSREGIGLYEGANHTDFYRGFTDCVESYHQYYRGWRRKAKQEEIREKIRQFYSGKRHEVELVSAEDISLLSASSLKSLREFLIQKCCFTKVIVACYLRAPLDYLNSSIQQFIKPGMTSLDDIRFNKFDNYRLQGCPEFEGGASNILKQIYFPIPEKLIQTFGKESVRFVDFGKVIKTGLTRELLKYARDDRDLAWLEERRSNDSMSHEACILIAEYNNRHPLLLQDNKLNKKRNREKCYVPFVREIQGRKAELIDVANLDVKSLNMGVKEVNNIIGSDMLKPIADVEASSVDSSLFSFSENSLIFLEQYLYDGAKVFDYNKALSIDELTSLNQALEKRRRRDCSWTSKFIYRMWH